MDQKEPWWCVCTPNGKPVSVPVPTEHACSREQRRLSHEMNERLVRMPVTLGEPKQYRPLEEI